MSNQVVLSKHTLAARLPSNNIPLSVASPTGDTSSAEYVRELVHGGASYQVIPSTITPFNYNAEGVLLGVLPKTKYLLIYLETFCWTSLCLFSTVETIRKKGTIMDATSSTTKDS
jgi:hypothetical protein